MATTIVEINHLQSPLESANGPDPKRWLALAVIAVAPNSWWCWMPR